MQVCKYANICKYASMHVYASMQVCIYMQVCKYANKCKAIYMSAVAAFFLPNLKNQPRSNFFLTSVCIV